MKLKEPKMTLKIEKTDEIENENPIIDGHEFVEEEDDTIFYFSNNSDEDFTTQWNKVKYTYPAKRRTRMSIRGATPEEVQSIRKMFAERYAQEQYMRTKDFNDRNKPLEGHYPVTYGKNVLQTWIDSCLVPLPKAKQIAEKGDSDEVPTSGTSIPLDNKSGAPYDVFKDAEVKTYGEMSNS